MTVLTSRSRTQSFKAKCSAAILRGLQFIYSVALDANNFTDYGSDLLWCFYLISSRSKDRYLAGLAKSMGQEMARRWRQEHQDLLSASDAASLFDYLYGDDGAQSLGIVDRSLTKKIRAAANHFSVTDYLGFDPRKEPPPDNFPDQCECGRWNKRGKSRCIKCGTRLEMMTKYGVWSDALTVTYWCEKYGSIQSLHYADVIKWLHYMRPYAIDQKNADADFYDLAYAITHVVYTLNEYSRYRLSPKWLPQEFEFLRSNFAIVLRREDPEMAGEFLDSLKSFGLDQRHSLIKEGMEYLLTVQNDDGSWGDPSSEDIYARYHPTWTAIDGLRDYAWKGKRLSRPSVFTLL